MTNKDMDAKRDEYNDYLQCNYDRNCAREKIYSYDKAIDHIRKLEVKPLQEKCDKLVDALEGYANPVAWSSMGDGAYADIGKVARKALEKHNE